MYGEGKIASTYVQSRLYRGRLGSDGAHESTLDIVPCIYAHRCRRSRAVGEVCNRFEDESLDTCARVCSGLT